MKAFNVFIGPIWYFVTVLYFVAHLCLQLEASLEVGRGNDNELWLLPEFTLMGGSAWGGGYNLQLQTTAC